MAGTVTRRLEIVNEKGLHARASAKLVELVEGFEVESRHARELIAHGADLRQGAQDGRDGGGNADIDGYQGRIRHGVDFFESP